MNEHNTNENTGVFHPEYKKSFTRIGLGLFLMLLISVAGAYLYRYLLSTVLAPYADSELLYWGVYCLLHYIVAFPIAVLVMKGAYSPLTPMAQRKLRSWEILAIVACMFALTFVGNYVGQFINSIISAATGGVSSTSGLTQMAEQTSTVGFFVVVVIIAPIMEELLFRYFLVDKLRPYGERVAVLLGGLFFGLFHGNLEQFFYTALVGAAFTYIYLKTGKIIYTIIFHMIMNFLSGFVPTLLTKYFVDYDAMLEELGGMIEFTGAEEQMAAFAEFFSKYASDYATIIGYNMIVLGLSLAGGIILLTQRRRINFKKGERTIDRSVIGETIFMSPGILIFIIGSLAYMGIQIYLQVI